MPCSPLIKWLTIHRLFCVKASEIAAELGLHPSIVKKSLPAIVEEAIVVTKRILEEVPDCDEAEGFMEYLERLQAVVRVIKDLNLRQQAVYAQRLKYAATLCSSPDKTTTFNFKFMGKTPSNGSQGSSGPSNNPSVNDDRAATGIKFLQARPPAFSEEEDRLLLKLKNERHSLDEITERFPEYTQLEITRHYRDLGRKRLNPEKQEDIDNEVMGITYEQRPSWDV